MTDNSGILSVDFLVGFTIFLLAFIWIATLIPTLFLGLSSQGIDYNAVAYRTGVILAEDSGATINGTIGTSWEEQPTNGTVARFGFAVSKDTPNILDERKVDRFFCSSVFVYPNDYLSRAIFGDYPYHFNITLNVTGEQHNWTIGEIIPKDYGYIRRDVRIKEPSNATINNITIAAFRYNNTEQVTSNWFSIKINSSNLVSGDYRTPVIDPNRDIDYRINPNTDQILINITNLESTRSSDNPLPPSLPQRSDVNLTKITFSKTTFGDTHLYLWSPSTSRNLTIFVDGNTSPVTPPVDIRSNLSLFFDSGFFYDPDPSATIYVNITFGGNRVCSGGTTDCKLQFLNNSLSYPFDYNYNPANVTQPQLHDGVLEVAVW